MLNEGWFNSNNFTFDLRVGQLSNCGVVWGSSVLTKESFMPVLPKWSCVHFFYMIRWMSRRKLIHRYCSVKQIHRKRKVSINRLHACIDIAREFPSLIFFTIAKRIFEFKAMFFHLSFDQSWIQIKTHIELDCEGEMTFDYTDPRLHMDY